MPTRTTRVLASALSLAATANSDVWRVDAYPNLGIHWWVTGTPTGALKVQVSNEESPWIDGYSGGSAANLDYLNTAITQWVNLADVMNFPADNEYAEASISSGSPAGGFVNIDAAGWKWLRLVYTRSSGTGTLTISAKGKRNKTSND